MGVLALEWLEKRGAETHRGQLGKVDRDRRVGCRKSDGQPRFGDWPSTSCGSGGDSNPRELDADATAVTELDSSLSATSSSS